MSGNGSPPDRGPVSERSGASEPSAGRAVVLGGGGLAGLAWLRGVLDELPDVIGSADRVVGTSAGGLLAARLLGGADADGLRAQLAELSGVRMGGGVVARLIAAQLWPSRRHALQWLGRGAGRHSAIAPEDFVALVTRAIGTTTWPASLVLAAVDGVAGRPAYFTPRSGVELGRAVAASCAMPGVLPPVTIDGRPFLDGGLRSPANADLAAGCDRVLILAPQGRSVRSVRRPGHQADRLRAEGADVVLIEDDRPDTDAMSATGLDAARTRGRAAGRTASDAVSELWRP